MACTPPLANWGKPHPHIGPDRIVARLALDKAGTVYFQGKPTDLARLASDLAEVHRMSPPEPILFLETEMGAPCATLDKVRTIANQQLKCGEIGHCDEGISAIWEAMVVSGGPVP